jgi:hypothetical protein
MAKPQLTAAAVQFHKKQPQQQQQERQACSSRIHQVVLLASARGQACSFGTRHLLPL